MDSSAKTFNEALALVRKLDADSQLRLLEEVAALLRRRIAGRPKHSIMELEGLGKEVWEGIDPQEYVDRERDAWGG